MNLDKRIKLVNEFSDIHPEYTSWMAFNDQPENTGTIKFVSYLRSSLEFSRLLATGHPYYKELLRKDIEDEKNRIIVIKRGGWAVLPHSKFNIHGLLETDKPGYRTKILDHL